MSMQRGWLRNSFPKGNKHTRKHSSTMSLHPLSQVPLALGTKKNPLLFSFMFFSFFFFSFSLTHTHVHTLGFITRYTCGSLPFFFFPVWFAPFCPFPFPSGSFYFKFQDLDRTVWTCCYRPTVSVQRSKTNGTTCRDVPV